MDWSGYLAQQGRNNDTLVAHITPEEAMMLKRMGGAGTRNPRTGLLEFFSGDSDDVGGDNDVDSSDRDTGMGMNSYGTIGGDWGEPGRYGGYSKANIGDIPDFWSNVPEVVQTALGKVLDLSFMDVVKGVIKGGLTVASIAQNPVMGLAKVALNMAGVKTNPAMGLASYAAGQVGKFGTPDSIAATEASFDTQVAEALSGKTKSSDWSSYEAVSAEDKMGTDEKSLDKMFSEYGKIGDLDSAVTAAKAFETKVAKDAELESAITQYSIDPIYSAIEPEFRVVADAAVESGMEPKAAAEYAFEKVKEAYNARKYIKELLARKTEEVSENGITNVDYKKSTGRPEWQDQIYRDRFRGYDNGGVEEYTVNPEGANSTIRRFVPQDTNDASDMDAADIALYRERIRRQGINL